MSEDDVDLRTIVDARLTVWVPNTEHPPPNTGTFWENAMSAKKIVCLGAGSLYFKRAVSDLLMSEVLSGSEIVLYDLVHEKSERVAAMGQRLAEEAGTGFRVRAAAELADAVDGADYALSSIGGSGAGIARGVYISYYHNADICISTKYGIQEMIADTGGMMMAFRSIPAYINICREMEKRCPKAILFNHSNPMAVLCRAMHKYTDIDVIGVCHGVQGGIKEVAGILDLPASELDCLWIGTNHYYWLTRVVHLGQDLYPELKRRIAERDTPERAQLSAKLSDIYGYRILSVSMLPVTGAYFSISISTESRAVDTSADERDARTSPGERRDGCGSRFGGKTGPKPQVWDRVSRRGAYGYGTNVVRRKDGSRLFSSSQAQRRASRCSWKSRP